jgi:hypothetical protein
MRHQWGPVLLSSASGALLGLYVAVLVPLSVAISRNDDPIHRGHYFEWGANLMVTLMPFGAVVLGVLSWLGWCTGLLRVLRWLGLALAILLLIYLVWGTM